MRIIAIINQKGGCGKTTTAINLSACLAELGCEVLLLDLDPQGHSSLGLGVMTDEIQKGMYEVLAKEATLEEALRPVRTNLDLVPATVSLAGIEQRFAGADHREKQLAMALSGLRRYYDYVLIDCPPGLGLLTINALMTSQEAIIPVEAGIFSYQGLNRLLETIEMVKTHGRRSLELRVLLTCFDQRTNHARACLDQYKETFGSLMFHTLIRQTVRLREAAREGMPINEYDRSSNGYTDYCALAQEIMASETRASIPDIPEREFVESMENVIRKGVD